MRKPKNTVISEKNAADTSAVENEATRKESIELKEEAAPNVDTEVPTAPAATTAAKEKKTTTRKTTTKTTKATAKTTKAAAKTDKKTEPKTTRTANAKAELFVQYGGREFSEQEIIERVQNIWVNDLGNKLSKLKDIKIYVKPEENTVYYVWNDSDGGSFTL